MSLVCPPLFLYVRSKAQRTTDNGLPSHKCGAPGEAAAEAAEEQQVAATEAAGAERFVECNGHAAGRSVSVAIDVSFHSGAVDGEGIGGGIEDADVGLVEHPQLHVGSLVAGGVENLSRGIIEQTHGPFEHRAPVHFYEPVIPRRAAIERCSRAALRPNEKLLARTIRAEGVRQQTLLRRTFSKKHGASAVAEERECFLILRVHHPAVRVGSHNQSNVA